MKRQPATQKTDEYGRYLLEGELAGGRYELLLPRDVSGRQGNFVGHSAGSSLDFSDFREYRPGDDLRRIDWGAYGRSDRLIVKLYHEEIDPHVDILIDCSKSMALEGTAKARAVLGMAAMLATAAGNSRCSSSPWSAGDGCRPVENGWDRPSAWAGITLDSTFNLSQSVEILPPVWRRRGIRILISDLLFPGDPTSLLTRFTEGASTAFVVQILAEADIHPPLLGNLMVEDSETGETAELLFDETARRQYEEAFSAHRQNWQTAARKTGARIITLTAEKIVENWTPEPLETAGILGGV